MKFDRGALLEQGGKLLDPDGLNGVRWPEPSVQRAYTGADDSVLLGRTVDFIEKLISAAPVIETNEWRGLDYGVGFGRIASVLTLFGDSSQLTCVDAWEKSLQLAKDSGLTNPSFLVDAMIGDGALPSGEFDFAYAYSIFTHLPEANFLHNVEKIMASLKPDGVFVFTVREPKFIEFLQRSNKYQPVVDAMETQGYWFGNAQSQDYGDTVVTAEWLSEKLGSLGRFEIMGVAPSEPFQCVVAMRR